MSVPAPANRRETQELRELLEANLNALDTLHQEHRRMLETSVKTISGLANGLRDELRAIGSVQAPWVRALAQTRALLFVALRELALSAHDAERTRHMSQEEIADAQRQA